MRRFFRSFFVFLFLISFLISPVAVKQSHAQTNFITSFAITYTVHENGVTHAVFNGTLQNTSDKYYASSYSLKAGFDNIQNVVAYDSDGAITPDIKKTDNGQTITLDFNHKAVGNGAILNFTLAFDTTDIAQHVGHIWEVNIPGLADQSDFKKFTVQLQVPNSFGPPAYIKPDKTSGTLTFSKDDLGSGGISMAFGKEQVYGFTLNYHLKNSNLFPIKTEIALPPTTNYQTVYLSDLSPKPLNVTQDADGNWLATYSVLPSQKLDVKAKGNVAISLTPKTETLTPEQRKIYLQPQQYWETQNSQIQQVAQDLKTPQAIFNYVVNHLHYDFSRIAGQQERLGGAKVLANSDSAVCLEFTDLFISLARAAGIPAREVDGYAFSSNKEERPVSLLKDVLHAWPEYYDDSVQAWVMVDPTWQNTTHGIDYFTSLDFDHVAFVIKGAKSDYPIPAGGYKLSGQENIKDVYVGTDIFDLDTTPKISYESHFPSGVISGLPVEGSVTIKNVGTTLVNPQQITAISDFLQPKNKLYTTKAIPPFGFITTNISFDKTPFLTNKTSQITIQVAGNTQNIWIRIYPFFFQTRFIQIGGIILGILCIGLFIIAAKTWGLSIFRRKG